MTGLSNVTEVVSSTSSMTNILSFLKFCLPVIILLGTVGNVLSFAVLIRRSMRSTPMYFYLMLLAVADTMVLYTSAFKTWIRVLTGYEALHVSDVGCKVITFLLLNSLYLSAWLVVLVTVDRFLVVWFPFHGYRVMRIQRARIIAVLLTLTVTLYNGHVFWTYGLQVEYENAVNGTHEAELVIFSCDWDDRSGMSEDVFQYLKLASYCIVPFVIVLALNVSIIVRLGQSDQLLHQSGNDVTRRYGNVTFVSGTSVSTMISMKQQSTRVHAVHGTIKSQVSSHPSVDASCSSETTDSRRCTEFSASRVASSLTKVSDSIKLGAVSEENRSDSVRVRNEPGDSSSRQRRLTRMLLCISFTWLTLTAPFALHVVVFDFIAKSSQPTIKMACFLLVYVNHASNFYLYCITGKRFRHELNAMLHLT